MKPLISIPTLKAHPDYPALLASLNSYMEWPEVHWQDSPEQMLMTVGVCAQLEAFTGVWPKAGITKPLLRRVRNEWPLPLYNFNHILSLNHIPTMYGASLLSPFAREELTPVLRWCESKFIQEPLYEAPIYSTNVGPALRSMAMIRELLYGLESAKEVALYGYGRDPTQGGLHKILSAYIDAFGIPKFDAAACNHWAYTARPALVWLMEVCGYKKYLGAALPIWGRFYKLPCKLLCVGGKSFTIPNVHDEYASNPTVGPVWAWPGDTDIDRWARYHGRTQSQLSLEWLTVPADTDYVPKIRPRACTGNRDFGRIKITETKTQSTVEYLGDGEPVQGGHRAGRAVTVIVNLNT